ncbi:hypothetical protein POTOM_001452 [Populus tomentosa]|uniref:Uncharacterized protein n=1 Tax=Populus tomentosa TaxID=118781 RepID=A0A8X8DI00_POPTO|nr:hypothetical protein POTOM_001452 [Populus tomentosa]
MGFKCRCYIKLFDSPSKSTAEEDDEMSKLPPSQRKKMRQKQKKAEARAKKEAEVRNEESSASGVSKLGKRHVKPVDPDPNGEKLLQVEDPLLEATKYLKLLQKHSPDSLETHLLSFNVNMRKKKILLALQALKQLLRLDAESADSHRCLVRFFHTVGTMTAPVTDTEKLVWSVLEAERPLISQLHEKSLTEANMIFFEKHEDSLMHRAAVAEMLSILEPNKKLEAVKLIEDSTNNPAPTNGALGPVNEWKLKDCIAVHKLLVEVLNDPDAALSNTKVLDTWCIFGGGGGNCVVPNTSLAQHTLKASAAQLYPIQCTVRLPTTLRMEAQTILMVVKLQILLDQMESWKLSRILPSEHEVK